MKIQCDACDKEEASVYCTADEAALCRGCDHRVHHANKLASKHHRFSLLSPKPKQLPLCDICQEKRALLFCQQDRAILCQDCDAPIHSATELTKKHDRFLLTGVKLSATSAVYIADESDAVPVLPSPPAVAPPSKQQKAAAEKRSELEGGTFTSSSISEYLMETLPGWHFEDLLCDSLSPSSGTFFHKESDESGLKYCCYSEEEEESLGLWVPPQYQTPPPMYMESSSSSSIINNSNIVLPPSNKRWWTQRNDDVFAVPEMSPPSSSPTAPRFKRSRHFH